MTTQKTAISKAVLLDNPTDEPIKETGLWIWLKDHYHPFSHLAILGYLEDTYGYMIGRETINDGTLQTLKTIYDYYTMIVMHPIWKQERKNGRSTSKHNKQD